MTINTSTVINLERNAHITMITDTAAIIKRKRQLKNKARRSVVMVMAIIVIMITSMGTVMTANINMIMTIIVIKK